jgi:GNAT superfamily N-acetyltransferase
VQPTDAEAAALFRELLVQHNAWAFLAYADNVPVGYLLALLQERQASPLTHARRWLYVDQISVEPAWERQGVGRRLLQKAIDLGRSLGIRELITDVWTFNGKAKVFFEDCGFQLQMERYSMHLGE